MRSLTIAFLFFSFAASAQLKVDTAYSIDDLVNKILLGKGVKVGNIKFKGHKVGLGAFETDSAVIGMNSGILLSTGSVFGATGENNTPAYSGVLNHYQTTKKQRKKRRKGDRDLNRICKGKTYDVNTIEFDFVPFHNMVKFNYCFASEEYKEYVGSRFNDVFAFIVKGPGVKKQNIAVLPNTKEPITINNVNHKKNKQFYINNDYFVNTGLFKNTSDQPKISLFKRMWLLFTKKTTGGNGLFYALEGEKKKLDQVLVNNFQYDGFTKVFTAEFEVIPFQKYHIKIAIGDVGDAIFDSGVFIEQSSFTSIRDTTVSNYVAYDDISESIDFDSIFSQKEKVVPTVEEEEFETTDVYFDNNETSIPDSAKANLDKLAEHLIKNQKLKCAFYGYTDNKGAKSHNQKLSEKRALKVMYYLKSKGVSRKRMEYHGNNSNAPIANNNTAEGRARNRRVEIIILDE